MGNYFSSGSMKFVPELSKEKFKKILQSHPLASDNKSVDGKIYQKILNEIYPQIEVEIFEIEKPYKSLGFP